MSARHLIHSIGFQTVDMASRVVLGGIGPAGHQIDQSTRQTQSAAPYVESEFITDATERFNFQTMAVGTVLENLALLGLNCVDTATAGVGLDLFGQQLSPCATGGRAAGSSHLRTRSTKARMVCQSLRVDGTGDAVATVEGVLVSSDGEAAPSVTVYNAALETPIVDETWRRGIVKANNVTLQADAIQSVSLEMQNEYRVTFGTGLEVVDVILLKSRPRLTITTEETDLYDAARLPRSAKVTAANTFFVLRKRDTSTGKLVAAASYVHKMVGLAGLMRVTQPAQGDSESPSTLQVIVGGAHATSGTSPLTVTDDVDAAGAVEP